LSLSSGVYFRNVFCCSGPSHPSARKHFGMREGQQWSTLSDTPLWAQGSAHSAHLCSTTGRRVSNNQQRSDRMTGRGLCAEVPPHRGLFEGFPYSIQSFIHSSLGRAEVSARRGPSSLHTLTDFNTGRGPYPG